jgi:hypothetical protein
VGSNPTLSAIKGLRYEYNRGGVFYYLEMPDIQGFCSTVATNEKAQKGYLKSQILFFPAYPDHYYNNVK